MTAVGVPYRPGRAVPDLLLPLAERAPHAREEVEPDPLGQRLVAVAELSQRRQQVAAAHLLPRLQKLGLTTHKSRHTLLARRSEHWGQRSVPAQVNPHIAVTDFVTVSSLRTSGAGKSGLRLLIFSCVRFKVDGNCAILRSCHNMVIGEVIELHLWGAITKRLLAKS